MTSKVKMGLIFGSGLALFSFIGNLLSFKNLSAFEIVKSAIPALVEGAVGGLIFAWLMGLFINSKMLNNSTKIEINPDEKLVFQTLASHFKGIEAVGGKLYLTDKRLIFKSHKLNIQNHELIIDLSSIINVSKAKTIGLVKNKLVIETGQNAKERFVVEKVDEWISHLK